MKEAIFCTRMYDPDARKLWWKRHRVRYNTEAELQARIAKIQARYRVWNGEEPRD